MYLKNNEALIISSSRFLLVSFNTVCFTLGRRFIQMRCFTSREDHCPPATQLDQRDHTNVFNYRLQITEMILMSNSNLVADTLDTIQIHS